ncbi:MAG: hypothetical protein JWQ02_2962 [Capsulimonas sp.]|jgi:hypothetical protein|nr:hypothetical protein [Capsulimonas sp.]
MPAGYSPNPLSVKLGLKDGMRTRFISAPADYHLLLGELPPPPDADGPLDFIQLFTKERLELETQFPVLMKELKPNGMLWISWPKKASKVATDLNDGVVREIGLSCGLVDVKVCAIDEVWSGLKFVYRTKDR